MTRMKRQKKPHGETALPIIEVLPGYPGTVQLRVTYDGWPAAAVSTARQICPSDGAGADSGAHTPPGNTRIRVGTRNGD